jgi:hypothetical protein
VRACGRDDQGLEARLLLQNYSNANLKFKYMWTVAKSNNDKDFIGTDITKVSVTCTITNGSRPSSMVYVRRGAKTCIDRKELDHCINQFSFNKFIIKHVISTLALRVT